MKNILVGISFSDQSVTVLKYALRLAQHLSASLTAVHILDYDNREVHRIKVHAGGDIDEVYESFRIEKEEKLKEFIADNHAKQFQDINIDLVVKFGYPHEALRFVAKEVGSELLILGKYTKTGSILVSDTADKVITWSQSPVLLVPEDAIFKPFDRIIYATDFVIEDCESILYLKPWLAIFGAKLICLHIYKNKEEEKSSRRKLKIFEKLFPEENITFRHAIADVEKGIDRYVELSNSDMVSTIHLKRSYWGSLFKKNMSRAIAGDVKVPMIVFHQ